MVEFFQDSYILAAHAHRVTVIIRDMISLRLIRFRYDKTLQPRGLSDMCMHNILSIPRVTRSGVHNPTHGIATRQNVQLKESEENQEDLLRDPQREQMAYEQSVHTMGVHALQYLGPTFDVGLLIRDQMEYFPFGLEEINILSTYGKKS